MKKILYPKLSKLDFGFIRSPGPGMGNLLFPISRCLSKLNDEPNSHEMIYPTIPQFKLGPIIRNEKSKRFYLKEFRNRSIKEWFKWIYFMIKSISYGNKNKNEFIQEEDLKNYFYEFSDKKNFILSWILDNMREKIKPHSIRSNIIGIHVRRGDFRKKNSHSLINQNTVNFQLNDDWYIKVVEKLLNENNKINQIIIFSDSREVDYLYDYFGKLVSTSFDDSITDVGSIISLSRCEYIVCSQSTFSMWAAFLGNSKCVWPLNFQLNSYMPIESRFAFF